jgi:hypothetical protein
MLEARIPPPAENPNGLHQRYRVTKMDGEYDPNAVYFVLRLDGQGDDPTWIKACRVAALRLAHELDVLKHMPHLADDLRSLVERLVAQDKSQ